LVNLIERIGAFVAGTLSDGEVNVDTRFRLMMRYSLVGAACSILEDISKDFEVLYEEGWRLLDTILTADDVEFERHISVIEKLVKAMEALKVLEALKVVREAHLSQQADGNLRQATSSASGGSPVDNQADGSRSYCSNKVACRIKKGQDDQLDSKGERYKKAIKAEFERNNGMINRSVQFVLPCGMESMKLEPVNGQQRGGIRFKMQGELLVNGKPAGVFAEVSKSGNICIKKTGCVIGSPSPSCAVMAALDKFIEEGLCLPKLIGTILIEDENPPTDSKTPRANPEKFEKIKHLVESWNLINHPAYGDFRHLVKYVNAGYPESSVLIEGLKIRPFEAVGGGVLKEIEGEDWKPMSFEFGPVGAADGVAGAVSGPVGAADGVAGAVSGPVGATDGVLIPAVAKLFASNLISPADGVAEEFFRLIGRRVVRKSPIRDAIAEYISKGCGIPYTDLEKQNGLAQEICIEVARYDIHVLPIFNAGLDSLRNPVLAKASLLNWEVLKTHLEDLEVKLNGIRESCFNLAYRYVQNHPRRIIPQPPVAFEEVSTRQAINFVTPDGEVRKCIKLKEVEGALQAHLNEINGEVISSNEQGNVAGKVQSGGKNVALRTSS